MDFLYKCSCGVLWAFVFGVRMVFEMIDLGILGVQLLIAQIIPPEVVSKTQGWTLVEYLTWFGMAVTSACLGLFWINQTLQSEMRKMAITALEAAKANETMVQEIKAQRAEIMALRSDVARLDATVVAMRAK